MPKLISFELTANSKAIEMKTNDAVQSASIDYTEVIIPIESIDHLVLEENEADGVNIILMSGEKHSIKHTDVSQVGANDYSNAPPYVYPDRSTFISDLVVLVGW